MKLSNHLADIHQLSGEERKYYLSGAKYLTDPEKPKDMLGWKRMRSDLNDDMSTSSRDEESEKGISSPKRRRNESDDEMSTVSSKNIFSSSDGGKNSEATDDAAIFDPVDGRTPPRWSDTSFSRAPLYLRPAETRLKAQWFVLLLLYLLLSPFCTYISHYGGHLRGCYFRS